MGKWSHWLCSLILLLGTPYLHAIEIGHVTEVDNKVELIRDGSVFALELGVAVSADDIVKTSGDGIVQIEMQDGSVFDIGPSSELHIAKYHLEENNQLQSGEVSLLTGWLRFITSKLNSGRSFDIYTPTMAIGIRGTEGIIGIEENVSELELTSGQVSVVGIDTLGDDFQETRAVGSGEYIRHQRDGSVKFLTESPESFRQRKHPRFKKALARKLKRLAKRGVLPKKLRNASIDDLKSLLKTNPRIRNRLFKHLQKRMQDPAFRSRMKKYLDKNPRLRKKLKSSKAFKQAVRENAKKKQNALAKKKRLEKNKRQQKKKYYRDR